MGRIHRLPGPLANQIAAGEVVERPASVVKELVENALDAGASRVTIAMDFGGKKALSVEDDGEGMSPEDARLALERHATSKIQSAADLAAIRTFGFRGEALPSIAAVSRFRLRTRAREALSGTEIRIEGGGAPDAREVGAPLGTLVDVSELFFNLPARRKFLKADTAEATQISRLVTQLALANPTVGFVLRSGARALLDVPGVASLDDRFYQIYRERLDLVPVRKDAAGISIRGFIAALGERGPARGPQHVFVNGRVVRDRTIAHAVQQAYSVATIKERSPEIHLFLELAADRVDVNVHPTKAEVRFLEQNMVHEVVRRALVDALGATGVPELLFSPVTIPAAVPGAPSPEPFAAGTSALALDRPVELGVPESEANRPARPPMVATLAPGQAGVADFLRPMAPLGQFRNTFIIAVDDDGLAIIDQHVAHERILFEQIADRLARETLESQRLLTPIVLDLEPGAQQALLGHVKDLAACGFDIDEFGPSSVRVSAVPALLEWSRSEAVLRAVVTDLDALGPTAGVGEALRRIAATMACHAAVKAHDPLTREKMQYLLDELRRTAHSSVCPHGRPVVLRVTRRELEKHFERI